MAPITRHGANAGPATALHGAAGLPIAQWKAHVLSQIAHEWTGRARPGAIRLRMSAGFMLLGAACGAGQGLIGATLTLSILSSVLLVHELAAALVARGLGQSSAITISLEGAQAELHGPRLRGAAALAYATAGSCANGLCVAGALLLAHRFPQAPVGAVLRAVAFAHGVWGALQLLPALPSRISGLLTHDFGAALRVAYASASLVFALTLGALAMRAAASPLLFVLIALWFGGGFRQTLDAWRENADREAGVPLAMLRAQAHLAAADFGSAVNLAREGLDRAGCVHHRRELWKTLAQAAIGTQDRFLLSMALLQLGAAQVDLTLLAAALSCWERDEEALALLVQARALGHRSREASKLLIDLHFRRGEHAQVLALAHADQQWLTLEDRAVIREALASE